MSDYILFKYRGINDYLFESLSKGSLYFSSPNDLNDPFDCQVDIKRCLENAMVIAEEGSRAEILSKTMFLEHAKKLQNQFLNVGVCSFSLIADNPLMWAHYANNHRGVCLAYRIPKEFFLDAKNQFIGLAPVTYGNNELQKWLRNEAPVHWRQGG